MLGKKINPRNSHNNQKYLAFDFFNKDTQTSVTSNKSQGKQSIVQKMDKKIQNDL
jgi:hypothetical protein